MICAGMWLFARVIPCESYCFRGTLLGLGGAKGRVPTSSSAQN